MLGANFLLGLLNNSQNIFDTVTFALTASLLHSSLQLISFPTEVEMEEFNAWLEAGALSMQVPKKGHRPLKDDGLVKIVSRDGRRTCPERNEWEICPTTLSRAVGYDEIGRREIIDTCQSALLAYSDERVSLSNRILLYTCWCDGSW